MLNGKVCTGDRTVDCFSFSLYAFMYLKKKKPYELLSSAGVRVKSGLFREYSDGIWRVCKVNFRCYNGVLTQASL